MNNDGNPVSEIDPCLNILQCRVHINPGPYSRELSVLVELGDMNQFSAQDLAILSKQYN